MSTPGSIDRWRVTFCVVVFLSLSISISETVSAAVRDVCDDIPWWTPSHNYQKGDPVQRAGRSFVAIRPNKGDRPGAGSQSLAWKETRECLVETEVLDPLPVAQGKDLSMFERLPIDDPYIDVHRIYDGIFAIRERFTEFEFEDVNAYLIVGTRKALLFDSGLGLGRFKQIVDELTDKPVLLVNSHYHYDHVAANFEFPFIMAADDQYTRIGQRGIGNAKLIEFFKVAYLGLGDEVGSQYHIEPYHVDVYLRDKTRINIGGVELEVITSPGHTPDSIVLLDEERGLMFTGDVFYQSGLLAHLPESNIDSYYETSQKLAALQHKVRRILPNHSVPMADGNAITRMAEAFTAIKKGKVGSPIGGGVLCHSFGGFQVIFREDPGAKKPGHDEDPIDLEALDACFLVKPTGQARP